MVLRREAFAVLLFFVASCARAGRDTFTCSESDAGAQCDAGEQCGMCLLLVNASACSSMSYHGNTKCWTVKRGEMCEGDGECGSDDDANNCPTQHGSELLKDVYLRVPCRGEVAANDGHGPGAGIGEELRAVFPLLIASVLCGWLIMRAWRKVHLPDGRPGASLAQDGAGGVQLEAVPRVPVARGVLVPLAEVQVQVAPVQAVAEVEGQEEPEEAEVAEEAEEAEVAGAPVAHDGPALEPESAESAESARAEAAAEPTEEALQQAVEQRSVEQSF